MPIRNTYVKKWAHHEINKAVNKLKRGHSLPKQLSKDRLKTFDHVYHRSEIRLASSIHNDDNKRENDSDHNHNRKRKKPRGEYLHEQIEKDKLNGLQPLDGGRDCCCSTHCQYTIIPGSFRNVLVQCSNGCYMRYHNDESDDTANGCWYLTKKNYKKANINDIDYSHKCIKKNCKGLIVSIVYCIGFTASGNEAKDKKTKAKSRSKESNHSHDHESQHSNLHKDDDDATTNTQMGNAIFDLSTLEEPPSGFDIFCKELFLKPDNRSLRPRVIDAKWRALSRPKRRRYDDRARILQLQWIRLKQKSQALDYALVDGAEHSKRDTPQHWQQKHTQNAQPNDDPQPNDEPSQKKKLLLKEERQKRIENMIAQNPNIYDMDERKKKEEHRKKTEKLLKMNKRKKKKIKSKKNKKSNKKNTVSLSDLNDIADQWASEKPLRSPSITPSHKSYDNLHSSTPTTQSSNVDATTDAPSLENANANEDDTNVPQPQLNPPTPKLQEWVNLAKQPKYQKDNTCNIVKGDKEKDKEKEEKEKEKEEKEREKEEKEKDKQLQMQRMMRERERDRQMEREKQKQKENERTKAKAAKIKTKSKDGSVSNWDKLKESIICGDRVFLEIPCSSNTSSPYLLVSTSSILQEWSDRLEDFHRWCTQYGLCRFLPISFNDNQRAVILEFLFVDNAVIAREKLMLKLHTEIKFVEWRFGHSYFFKHSYVKLNEEIMMTGKEFKRMDQILLKDTKNNNNNYNQRVNKRKIVRPWEAYPHLSLPRDYGADSVSSDVESTLSSSPYQCNTTAEEEDDEEDPEDLHTADDGNENEHDTESETEEQDKVHSNANMKQNKINYKGRTLYIGDIVYMASHPHVPFIIHKSLGNGFVEILKPDNNKECVEICALQNALSFPSLHQDTKNENELRFRQSLLEDLSENQLDYLLVCME